ncbi:hypothetical protein BIM11_4079 [Burkholderia pseudomallei]|nr:hypothetical protein BIM11_4079 [Burkholderia pseudomallei]
MLCQFRALAAHTIAVLVHAFVIFRLTLRSGRCCLCVCGLRGGCNTCQLIEDRATSIGSLEHLRHFDKHTALFVCQAHRLRSGRCCRACFLPCIPQPLDCTDFRKAITPRLERHRPFVGRRCRRLAITRFEIEAPSVVARLRGSRSAALTRVVGRRCCGQLDRGCGEGRFCAFEAVEERKDRRWLRGSEIRLGRPRFRADTVKLHADRHMVVIAVIRFERNAAFAFACGACDIAAIRPAFDSFCAVDVLRRNCARSQFQRRDVLVRQRISAALLLVVHGRTSIQDGLRISTAHGVVITSCKAASSHPMTHSSPTTLRSSW